MYMNVRWLGAPFAWLYGLIMAVRGGLYDVGCLRVYRFSMPILSVGNIAVGGTGKTPHVVHFARELQASGHKVAVLSRGYKRKTRGFILVERGMTAREVGDEPLEMRRKLGDDVLVAVDRDRVHGVRQLLAAEPGLDVVLLDDGMQHRRLGRSLDILLTDYSRPYTEDRVMPWGRLREWRSGARRAGVVIVTKVPRVGQSVEAWRRRLRLQPEQQLFFSRIKYSFPDSLSRSCVGMRVLLVCGIANPRPLVEEIERRGAKVETMLFADHHAYTPRDLKQIAERARGADVVLTTAKDAARLGDGLECGYEVVDIDVEIEYFRITDYVAED